MNESEWFLGSCHCERVVFRVRPRTRRALDCNCSICTKKGFLHVIVEQEDFELIKGQDHLKTYTFNTGVARHHFCRHCGIHPFYRPRSHPDDISVNLHCLAPELFPTFEISAFDGQNWEANIQKIR